jgi:hypothetical protein
MFKYIKKFFKTLFAEHIDDRKVYYVLVRNF